VVVGGAEVGVVREAMEGGHSGLLTVNILVVTEAMVVATAPMEGMATPLLPPLVLTEEAGLMEHLDMIREVRNELLLLCDCTTLYAV
jgi:hypothetical protein